ncbi:MAG: VIT1/CCC1 transporter family protein [Candidatus Woesearchaeota archaeon]
MLDILRLAGSRKIIRRYIVINGFDGAIVLLGVLFSSFLVGADDARVILAAGLGAGVALLVSGISGAYLSEKAEKEKELKDMEKAMVKKLGRTDFGRALKAAPLITAMAHGLSPFLISLVILLPFMIGPLAGIPLDAMYYLSFGLSAISLFLLGIFMGRISNKGILFYGIVTLVVGLVTAALLFLIDKITGLG